MSLFRLLLLLLLLTSSRLLTLGIAKLVWLCARLNAALLLLTSSLHSLRQLKTSHVKSANYKRENPKHQTRQMQT